MSSLRYRQSNRRAANHQNATPDPVVKEIDFVMRAASERPHGQVESEWRPRPKREGEFWHWKRRASCYSISLSGMFFGAAAVDFVPAVLEAVAAGGVFLCSYL